MNLDYIKSHLYTFFVTNIEMNESRINYLISRETIIPIINKCFLPLHYLLRLSIATPSFQVSPNRPIKVNSLEKNDKNPNPHISNIVLSILFVAPASIIGIALKISLLIASPTFYNQHWTLAQHHLENNKNLLAISKSTLKSIDGLNILPSDVLIYLVRFLSVQEISKMNQVCKSWNQFWDSHQVWKIQASYYLERTGKQLVQEEATKQNLRKTFFNLQNAWSSDTISAFGGIGRILQLPYLPTQESIKNYSGLKKAIEKISIVRNFKGNQIAFHCFDQVKREEGVLVLSSCLLYSNQSLQIDWINFNGGLTKSTDFHSQWTNLLQGEPINIVHQAGNINLKLITL